MIAFVSALKLNETVSKKALDNEDNVCYIYYNDCEQAAAYRP